MYKLIFYKLKLLDKDRKYLLKVPTDFKRIQVCLGKLGADPFARNLATKKLINSKEATFRLRIGKFRVLFDVDTNNKIIIVYRIKQRKEGYA
jgi:mRNA interferase RelE/StbE